MISVFACYLTLHPAPSVHPFTHKKHTKIPQILPMFEKNIIFRMRLIICYKSCSRSCSRFFTLQPGLYILEFPPGKGGKSKGLEQRCHNLFLHRIDQVNRIMVVPKKGMDSVSTFVDFLPVSLFPMSKCCLLSEQYVLETTRYHKIKYLRFLPLPCRYL